MNTVLQIIQHMNAGMTVDDFPLAILPAADVSDAQGARLDKPAILGTHGTS